jgi:serine/threonine protein kinase/TolA-binding protein
MSRPVPPKPKAPPPPPPRPRPPRGSAAALAQELADELATGVVEKTQIPVGSAPLEVPDDTPTRMAPAAPPDDTPTRLQPAVAEDTPTRMEPPPEDTPTRLQAAAGVQRRPSGEYVSGSLSLTSHTQTGSGPLPAVPLGRGTELGRYVVLDHLGSGGLGDVFTAWDPELDRKVALKLLKSAAYGRVDLSRLHGRLLREAQAMARLSHPNVVTVHDVGLSDSRIFIAMEFVDGVTLKEWIKDRTRPWQEVRDVLLQAGQGLIAAHAANLVHRDFKPSNIIVDKNGRVRVLDFGLARRPNDERYSDDSLERSGDSLDPATSGRALIDEAITQTGTVLGTPAYMAPEQYAQEMVDGLADQFAFCVTAFEAFYGQRPFLGKGEELVKAIRGGTVTWPKNEGRIPKFMRKALARGLSVDSAKRFPDMPSLLQAMQADRRNKRRAGIALALSAVLSAGGGAAAYAFLQPPPPEKDERVDNLVDLAYESAAKSFYVYPPPSDPDAATAYNSVLELEELDGDIEELADQAAEGLRIEFAGTLVSLGDKYFEIDGGIPFATDYYAQALLFDPDNERAQERLVMTPGELAALRSKAEDKKFSSAELEAAELLAILADEDEEKQDEKLAVVYKKKKHRRSLSTSAQVEQLLGERATAVFAEPKLEPKPKAKPEPEPEPVVEDEPVEDELIEEGELVEDEPGSAKGKRGKKGPKAGPATAGEPRKRDSVGAQTLVDQAKAAKKSGNFAKAEALLHQALEKDHLSHQALYALSDLHYQKGRYGKAAKYANSAVRLNPKSGRYRIQLGDAYFKVLRYPEARKHYEKAAELGESRANGRLARLKKTLGE